MYTPSSQLRRLENKHELQPNYNWTLDRGNGLIEACVLGCVPFELSNFSVTNAFVFHWVKKSVNVWWFLITLKTPAVRVNAADHVILPILLPLHCRVTGYG